MVLSLHHRVPRWALAASWVITSACLAPSVDVWLEGDVTSADTGEPVAGAVALLMWDEGAVNIMSAEATSDTTGRFTLRRDSVRCDGLSLYVGSPSHEVWTAPAVACTSSRQAFAPVLQPR